MIVITYSSLDVELIYQFLKDNFNKQITNQILADKFHYHAYYINRVFKNKKGLTIRRFIIECRINEAKIRLKNENTPISAIAFECGFESSAYFSRYFKTCVGVSPSEYRKLNI